MHLAPDNFRPRIRVMPFPAPLCEACNEAMGLNGEYTPTVNGKMSAVREYQCKSCGAGKMVRLSTCRAVS
jgi:hypothetical protein